jgi:hypothetical protein
MKNIIWCLLLFSCLLISTDITAFTLTLLSARTGFGYKLTRNNPIAARQVKADIIKHHNLFVEPGSKLPEESRRAINDLAIDSVALIENKKEVPTNFIFTKDATIRYIILSEADPIHYLL